MPSSASVQRADGGEHAGHPKNEEKQGGPAPLYPCYVARKLQRKPIDGIGEPPMLTNG